MSLADSSPKSQSKMIDRQMIPAAEKSWIMMIEKLATNL
jgi:hypothetical protein